jgi:DNA topoisomerase II
MIWLDVKDVKVFLNNERLKLKNFKEYMQLYLAEHKELQSLIVYKHVNERWEIGVLPSPESQFQQVGICSLILH